MNLYSCEDNQKAKDLLEQAWEERTSIRDSLCGDSEVWLESVGRLLGKTEKYKITVTASAIMDEPGYADAAALLTDIREFGAGKFVFYKESHDVEVEDVQVEPYYE